MQEVLIDGDQLVAEDLVEVLVQQTAGTRNRFYIGKNGRDLQRKPIERRIGKARWYKKMSQQHNDAVDL